RMSDDRSRALEKLVSELEEFKVEINEYYGDLEPQSVYDTVLTGKLETLASFCDALGWSGLTAHIKSLLPFRCSAIEGMEQVQGFILPEIRRLMEKGVDAAVSPPDWFW